MTRTVGLVSLVSLLLAGCATPSHLMYNPASRETVRCAATGWGLIGAHLALISAKHCVDDYEKLGFVKMPE